MPTTPKGKATPIGFSRRSIAWSQATCSGPEGLLRYGVGKGIGDHFPNRELGTKWPHGEALLFASIRYWKERLAALNNRYGVDSTKDCVHALNWHIRFTLDGQWL